MVWGGWGGVGESKLGVVGGNSAVQRLKEGDFSPRYVGS